MNMSKSGLPHWSAKQRRRLAECIDQGAAIAYWNSDAHGYPSNGGRRDFRARPGLVQVVDGPLSMCGPGALHATHEPHLWGGCRVWVVALFGEVAIQGDKVGALRREIIGEVLPHEAWSPSVGVRLGRIDLAGANLAYANLADAYLAGADLEGANLAHASLAHANLADAYLAGANLARANLADAYLAGANLARANLEGANLARANLAHANLGDWKRGPDGYAQRTGVTR